MVKASDIATYADFDVCTQAGGAEARLRPALSQSGTGAQHTSPLTKFTHREWTTVVRIASHADFVYLRRAWDLSSKGVLPVSATPPWDSVKIPAVFVDDQLGFILQRGRRGAYTVRLMEWNG